MENIKETEAGELQVIKSIDDEFTRTNYLPNSSHLSESEKELKIFEMKELIRLNPTVPEFWLDMCWNFHHANPEKCEEIRENDLWREKSTKYEKGGILSSVSIEEGIRNEQGALMMKEIENIA